MLHSLVWKPFTAFVFAGESGFDSALGCAQKGDVVTMEQMNRKCRHSRAEVYSLP
jgi:hypothetical protein